MSTGVHRVHLFHEYSFMQSLNQPQVGDDLYWECNFKLSSSPPVMETWKISLLPTPFYLFLANIPFKGHLLVWMSSRQLPTFIPCCLPKHSYKPKFAPMPTAAITINGLKWLNHWGPEGKCLHSVSVTICFMGSVDCSCKTFAFISRVVWWSGSFFLLLNPPQFSLADPECHERCTRRNKLDLRTSNCTAITQGVLSSLWIQMPNLNWEDALSASTTINTIQKQDLWTENQASIFKGFCGWLQKFHRKSEFRVGHRSGFMDWKRSQWFCLCAALGEEKIHTSWDSQNSQNQQPSHGWVRAHLKNNIIVQRHEWKGFFFVEREKVYLGICNPEREDEVCSICLGLVLQVWVNPANFHGTRELQPRGLSDQSLIKGKFPGDLTFVKIIQLDVLAINVSSSLSCSAFYLGADFDQCFYSSLGHRGFCISSWILLHKVFFVHWEAGELAPCEPVEFIKPASTNLSWLLLQK